MSSTARPWTEALLHDTKYSDLALICEGRSYSAHKAVVCSQSPVLAAACSNAVYLESRSNSVEITITGHRVFELVLKYLYTGQCGTSEERLVRANELIALQPSKKDDNDADETIETYRIMNAPLLLFVRLFQVADYYQIEHMKTEVCKELKLVTGLYWVLSPFGWPEMEVGVPAKLFDCFAEVVREVFEISSANENRLKDALVSMMEYRGEDFAKSPAFLALAQDCPEFVQAVMVQELSNLKSIRTTATDDQCLDFLSVQGNAHSNTMQ